MERPQHIQKHRMPFALELALTVVVGVVVALVLRLFVFEVFYVPSGSMLNTIQIGDQLVGEKISLLWSGPKQEDIVTFISPQDNATTLAKRVVATGGDVVDLKDGHLYVNGELKEHAYTEGKETLPLNVAGSVQISYPYTVPANSVFVMGDNRTNSLDSRYFGAVPLKNVTSIIKLKFWPLSSITLY